MHHAVTWYFSFGVEIGCLIFVFGGPVACLAIWKAWHLLVFPARVCGYIHTFIPKGSCDRLICDQILYSQKLSRVKTFVNFAVLPLFAKVLSANVFGWGERVGGESTWAGGIAHVRKIEVRAWPVWPWLSWPYP